MALGERILRVETAAVVAAALALSGGAEKSASAGAESPGDAVR
jgi:hypothetical protein